MIRIVLTVIAAVVPLAAGTVSCTAVSAVVTLHCESASMPAVVDLGVNAVQLVLEPTGLSLAGLGIPGGVIRRRLA